MIFSIFLVLLSSTSLVAAGPAPTTVNLGYASYQGVLNETTRLVSFLGIRYASPPEGDLRWRAPQPPPVISGVQQADTQPNQCFQAQFGAASQNPLRNFQLSNGQTSDMMRRAVPDQSEDCLFLNVHISQDMPQDKMLPVVVWFHGGGYISGQGSTFDGGDLVRQANGSTITVVVQYRLGVFGFLAGTQVKENGDLNAGLLDQEFALKWVQENISKFNGDPSQVTIWGQSAGAGSVLQHVVARDGQTGTSLFRNVMTSSTFLPPQYKFDHNIPEGLFYEVVTQARCCCANDMLACLREQDPAVIQAANLAINRAGLFGTFTFVPVVDGTFIVKSPIESLMSGRVNGKRLLSVTNSNEAQIFVNTTITPVDAKDYSLLLFPTFKSDQATSVSDLYADLGTPVQQLVQIQSESIFVCPTYSLLNAFKGSAFKAEFAVPPGVHASDLPFYFPTGRNVTFDNQDFIAAFANSFASFILSEDPNQRIGDEAADIKPSWQTFDATKTEMLFNRTEDGQADVKIITTDAGRLERCQFWESLAPFTSQ